MYRTLHTHYVVWQTKGTFTLIRVRVRVLHEIAGESGRHVKSMDCTEKADADADEGRGRWRGPV